MFNAEYMLDPDPDTRPDVYQVGQFAFAAANSPNPIKNIKVRLACFVVAANAVKRSVAHDLKSIA